MIKDILSLCIITIVLFSCNSSRHAFSKRDIKSAEKLYGLHFSSNEIDTMYGYLERNLEGYDTLRAHKISNDVLPAIMFSPLPLQYKFPEGVNCQYVPKEISIDVPKDSILAFMTVKELASLIKTGKISSEYLTKLYISRIKKYDGTLKSVITLIEDDAIKKAQKADVEIKNGNYKGPLHGIPYGVKDLVAVEGYPTTWGAMPYKNQKIDQTATIIEKLEESGAILIAKLSSGALARGDVWWGGRTVNPWDTLQGASGSSAGPGAATSAGLVGFSIGTETLGSITSPSTQNGITGLRPTYGRISRYGVMPLSWSMDKLGPMCRSAEDCLLVFQTIAGIDPRDPTLYDVPFCYVDNSEIKDYKIGFLESLFVKDTSFSMKTTLIAIDSLKALGLQFISDSLPSNFPFQAFDIILRSEAGAFFDELVRSGNVDLMVEQNTGSRANSLRQSRFIPAVEYIQANRHRSVLIEEMNAFMGKYDAVISPTFGGDQLMITNLTGHPVITVPTGIDSKGHPTSVTFIGRLFEEDKIIRIAKYFQEMTTFDNAHPPLFGG